MRISLAECHPERRNSSRLSAKYFVVEGPRGDLKALQAMQGILSARFVLTDEVLKRTPGVAAYAARIHGVLRLRHHFALRNGGYTQDDKAKKGQNKKRGAEAPQ